MVSILEPLRPPHRTHSSTKQHSKIYVLGQARILLCDVGRFFENAPLGRLKRKNNRITMLKVNNLCLVILFY